MSCVVFLFLVQERKVLVMFIYAAYTTLQLPLEILDNWSSGYFYYESCSFYSLKVQFLGQNKKIVAEKNLLFKENCL